MEHVKSGLEGKTFPVPSEPVVLDQNGCIYVPHVIGIQVGQTLQIVNSDETLHNIHAMPKNNKEFNIGQPVKGLKTDRTFDAVEVMVPFKCDVHKWMNAYVGVVDHPFFGTTGEAGSFELHEGPSDVAELTSPTSVQCPPTAVGEHVGVRPRSNSSSEHRRGRSKAPRLVRLPSPRLYAQAETTPFVIAPAAAPPITAPRSSTCRWAGASAPRCWRRR